MATITKVTKLALMEAERDLREAYYAIHTTLNKMGSDNLDEPTDFQLQQMRSRVRQAVNGAGQLAEMFPDEIGFASPTPGGFQITRVVA